MGKLHQHSFRIQTCSAVRRSAVALRRTPQDRADIAAGMDDIERPGLLAGAAGKPDRPDEPTQRPSSASIICP
jgi:hypothetical protein